MPYGMIYYLFQYIEDNLCVMSVGFLLSGPDEAVIWRGPKKNGLFLVQLFLKKISRYYHSLVVSLVMGKL